MKLGDAGESRLRGYLYVFERTMRSSSVSGEITAEALREVESHIRERVAGLDPSAPEREALEGILVQLGPPAQVAQAYSLELVMDEAAATGRLAAVGRALVQLAATGVVGFLAAVALFVGYVTGGAFLALAILQPIFPSNVGLWVRNGVPRSFGAQFPPPEGMELVGGYWIIPVVLIIGLAVLLVTHSAARRFIAAMRLRLAARHPALPFASV
jgi:hypothetical protein